MGDSVTATGLGRRFGHTQAVTDVDVTLRQGEVLGLLGANGAGKSTTLRLLTGALAADAGRVEICGHDLQQQPLAAKRHIGYLPEHPPLYPELTVAEYLGFCARLHGLRRRQRRTALSAALADCDLEAVADRLIGNLSKGYQQRIGIAQAIIHRPDVIILDEPGAGLDPHQIRHMRALISRLAEQHSIIVSSHILPEIQAVASRVMLMHQGRVALDTALATLASGQAATLRLELTTAPAAAALTAIHGVANVQQLSTTRWRITPSAGNDPTAALARTALDNDWGLLALAPEQRTLEEIFIDVTSHDAAATP